MSADNPSNCGHPSRHKWEVGEDGYCSMCRARVVPPNEIADATTGGSLITSNEQAAPKRAKGGKVH